MVIVAGAREYFQEFVRVGISGITSGCSSLSGTERPLFPTTRAWKHFSSRGSFTPQECANYFAACGYDAD